VRKAEPLHPLEDHPHRIVLRVSGSSSSSVPTI
jgi:hypothetical protein